MNSKLKIWSMIIGVGLLGLAVCVVALVILAIDIFLLYFIATSILKVDFNYSFAMLLLGVIVLFSIWLVVRPLAKMGIQLCQASLKTERFYETAKRDPRKAEQLLKALKTKKRR